MKWTGEAGSTVEVILDTSMSEVILLDDLDDRIEHIRENLSNFY